MIKTTKKLILQLLIFAALVLTVLLGMKKISIPEIEVPKPHISHESVLGFKAGLRPYRKHGIRLEPEYSNGKLFIHDYGHGGSGISLSWGSARISLDLLEQELSKGFVHSHEAAVIGSGIIGLTTAHLLNDQGWKVHIYASQFPPYTTSDIAPGLWNVVLVGEGEDEGQKKLFDAILSRSFETFSALSQDPNPEFKGVSPLIIYTFKKNALEKKRPKGLFYEGFPVDILFDGEDKRRGVRFQSMIIDTTLYLPDLYEKAKTKGIQFTQITFHDKEDIARLPQSIIFNCTGLGSKELFHDEELQPIKGELIELKPQTGLDMMLSGPIKGELDLYLIPLHDRLILGGSYEMNVTDPTPNPKICEEILDHARQFFDQGIQ